MASNDLLSKMEQLITEYFEDIDLAVKGLPTVHYFADRLYVSSNYLSDMLRTLTGMTTQQHIHNKVIEKAKILLTTTNLSISEVAFALGFNYPQSFNRLFKNHTKTSPVVFRNCFN